jgi:hypothetical protein
MTEKPDRPTRPRVELLPLPCDTSALRVSAFQRFCDGATTAMSACTRRAPRMHGNTRNVVDRCACMAGLDGLVRRWHAWTREPEPNGYFDVSCQTARRWKKKNASQSRRQIIALADSPLIPSRRPIQRMQFSTVALDALRWTVDVLFSRPLSCFSGGVCYQLNVLFY